jgi:hypothetical protein
MVELVDQNHYERDPDLYQDAADIVDLDIDFETTDPFEALNEREKQELARGLDYIFDALSDIGGMDKGQRYGEINERNRILSKAHELRVLHPGGVAKAGADEVGAISSNAPDYLLND